MTDRQELKKLLSRDRHQVYTVLRGVSRSSMTRWLDLFVIIKNEPYRITYSVANILDWKYSRKREAIIVNGCGMDMGFHTVYSLSRVLYPKGFKVNGIGRNGDTSGWDKDGGYKLKQRWL